MMSKLLLPAIAVAFLSSAGMSAIAAQSGSGGCADFGGAWQPGTIVIEEQPASFETDDASENIRWQADCNQVV